MSLVCEHCLLEFPEREAVRVAFSDSEKVFCCGGCAGVFRLVHEEGLDAFYERRDGWRPGPPRVEAVPETLFVSDIRDLGDRKELDLLIGGIRCASCVWLTERLLRAVDGVQDVRVNYATHRARLRWDPARVELGTLLARIASAGYVPSPYQPGTDDLQGGRETRDLLTRFGTAAFFSMQLMMLSGGLYAGFFEGISLQTARLLAWLSFLLCLPVVFYAGAPFHRAALRGLSNGLFNMDVLVSIGSLSAFGVGVHGLLSGGEIYFDTAAMIVSFILLGRLIELRGRVRASDAVRKLAGLVPHVARRLIPAAHEKPDPALKDWAAMKRETIPSEQLTSGDLVEVLPGERAPRDGQVVHGSAEFDESLLTGESRPVPKKTTDGIIGGTVACSGTVIVRVTAEADRTLLSGILRAVEDAQARRAPTERLADRVTAYFTPGVLAVAVAAGLVVLLRAGTTGDALMRSVSVLVVACPCALGLATPLAVLTALGAAAQRGVLIRGGETLERIRAIDTIVLDKTGTLTTGRFEVGGVLADGIEATDTLRMAAALESLSTHPVARALQHAAGPGKLPVFSDIRTEPGLGMAGRYRDCTWRIGNRRYLEIRGDRLPESLEPAGSTFRGMTPVFLSRDGVGLARIDLHDEIRPEAPRVLAELSGYRTLLLTGDTEDAAKPVAAKTGIGEIRASLLPAQKMDTIRNLRESGRRVAMVGDGVNDAPSLAEADLGIAMAHGSEIAFDAADVVLLSADLGGVTEALRIGCKGNAVIRQNLFWAFGYNLLMIPLAAAGFLHPILSAGAMAFSSVSVVLNSLRAR